MVTRKLQITGADFRQIDSEVKSEVEQYFTDRPIDNTLIDKIRPSFEESGVMVTCEPVEGYPLTVQTADGATKVTRTGKNLFDFKQGVSLISGLDKYGYVIYLPVGTYTLHSEPADIVLSDENLRYLYGRLRKTDGSYVNIRTVINTKLETQTFTIEAGDYLQIYNGSAKSEAESNKLFQQEFNVQLELGSTATAYEPYNGDEFAAGESIPPIPGINYIRADSGEITVTGKKDPIKVIEKLTNAIIALGGNV